MQTVLKDGLSTEDADRLTRAFRALAAFGSTGKGRAYNYGNRIHAAVDEATEAIQGLADDIKTANKLA